MGAEEWVIILKCNMNVKVYVKLTDKGHSILRDHYKNLSFIPEPNKYDGYSEFQLWELMSIFGNSLYNGCDIPFQNNEIVFVK